MSGVEDSFPKFSSATFLTFKVKGLPGLGFHCDWSFKTQLNLYQTGLAYRKLLISPRYDPYVCHTSLCLKFKSTCCSNNHKKKKCFEKARQRMYFDLYSVWPWCVNWIVSNYLWFYFGQSQTVSWSLLDSHFGKINFFCVDWVWVSFLGVFFGSGPKLLVTDQKPLQCADLYSE